MVANAHVLPKIERYEIDREIGHGGMATVYRGRDVRLDRWVAIKVMHPHLRGAQEARARFAREARAVAKLHHPSVLEIYDYSGEGSSDAYIATELLTGPTLRGFADDHPDLPAEIVACIGVELAGALAAAHAEGIVHRDVKPENVLMHEDRCIKLTDFGIAGMLDPSASAMTATGQILGSPAHMSPEQITDGSADARSDVFALGTILYWLATGRLPFDGKNAHQILKRVVDDPPVEPLRLRPVLGKELNAVLMRCLEKAPADRFQSAAALGDALRDWLGALGIDNPRQTLARYLADPAQMTEQLRETTLRALLDRATTEIEARRRVDAMDSLDRVFALDDGNETGLALLARLDRAARMRTGLRWAAAAAALSVAAVAGVVWLGGSPEGSAGAHATELRAEQAETAEALASLPSEPDVESTPLESTSSTATDEAPSDDAPPEEVPVVQPTRPAAPKPRPRGPRKILFKPYPVNVSIAVDDGPLRPLGPNFQSVELLAGEHRFRFVGARDCCDDKVLTVDVPAGPGTTVLEPRLAFRPAGLYVVSNVPANVDVSGGLAGGRTRSVIKVPVERSLFEPHRISVTAPGYAPYTGNVSLRAGKVKEVEVTLEASGTTM